LSDNDDWGVTTAIKDNVDGVLVQTSQEVAPILEANVAEYNSGNMGKTSLGWGRKVAEIPMGVVLAWKQIYGVDCFDKNHASAVRRLLNSSEWLYLRTAPGELAR
jgi:hypothetical protein